MGRVAICASVLPQMLSTREGICLYSVLSPQHSVLYFVTFSPPNGASLRMNARIAPKTVTGSSAHD
jgi:hypothetical protein